MKIKADKEAIQVIMQLLDLALKTSGLSVMKQINETLANIEEIKEEDDV